MNFKKKLSLVLVLTMILTALSPVSKAMEDQKHEEGITEVLTEQDKRQLNEEETNDTDPSKPVITWLKDPARLDISTTYEGQIIGDDGHFSDELEGTDKTLIRIKHVLSNNVRYRSAEDFDGELSYNIQIDSKLLNHLEEDDFIKVWQVFDETNVDEHYGSDLNPVVKIPKSAFLENGQIRIVADEKKAPKKSHGEIYPDEPGIIYVNTAISFLNKYAKSPKKSASIIDIPVVRDEEQQDNIDLSENSFYIKTWFTDNEDKIIKHSDANSSIKKVPVEVNYYVVDPIGNLLDVNNFRETTNKEEAKLKTQYYSLFENDQINTKLLIDNEDIYFSITKIDPEGELTISDDQQRIDVYLQNLIVEGTDPTDPTRPGYERIEFYAQDIDDEEAIKGVLKSTKTGSKFNAEQYLYYDISNELSFEFVPEPEIIPAEGYYISVDNKWDPELPSLDTNLKDVEESSFIAQYQKRVDPIKPIEPVNPTPPDTEDPSPDQGLDTDRIHGIDRIVTAIELSKQKYDAADTVIIARHDVFADALVAAPLAYALDAPILLSKPHEFLQIVGDEIERLGAKNVIIVGGHSSIDDHVEDALEVYDENDEVERLSGPNRYDTSAKVAYRLQEIYGDREDVIIATGESYPDALAVGPYAARDGKPILLVHPHKIPQVIEQAMTDIGTQSIEIVGGYSSVGKELEKDLPKLVARYQGKDRYETAVAIAKETKKDAKVIYLASGEIFADALVAGPVAAKDDAPILLTRRNEVPKVVRDYLEGKEIDKLTIIGGRNTITDASIKSLYQ